MILTELLDLALPLAAALAAATGLATAFINSFLGAEGITLPGEPGTLPPQAALVGLRRGRRLGVACCNSSHLIRSREALQGSALAGMRVWICSIETEQIH